MTTGGLLDPYPQLAVRESSSFAPMVEEPMTRATITAGSTILAGMRLNIRSASGRKFLGAIRPQQRDVSRHDMATPSLGLEETSADFEEFAKAKSAPIPPTSIGQSGEECVFLIARSRMSYGGACMSRYRTIEP